MPLFSHLMDRAKCHACAMLTMILMLPHCELSRADDWPTWRGPDYNGLTTETDLPLRWDQDHNVQWKTLIPGVGHSSPIVWNDAIFVTTSEASDLSRRLLRIDRETGDVVWNVTVGTAPFEEMHRDNTPASATPATDGTSVYTAFCLDGRLAVSAFDFDGKLIWNVSPGDFYSRHGFCTALILDGNRLIISGLQDGPDAFVAAINKNTGNLIWKTKRPNNVRSFSSPFLCQIDGRPAIVLSGAGQTIAYDRTDGQALWTIEGPASKTVSSIVGSEKLGLAFVCGGRDDTFFALKLNGEGDQIDARKSEESSDRLVWTATKGIPYMTSPLLNGNLLHILSDEGVYRCYDARTGELRNTKRAVRDVRASMVANDERIYILERDGRTTVIANNDRFEVLAENDLGESVYASPAISNGDLIIRAENHLWLIREEGKKQ